jgi:hypothetical protein
MPRLPPSLKWLIVQRGRVDGEIQKIKEQILEKQDALNSYQKKIEELSAQLSIKKASLQETLAAIDKTLSLHEIQIDPENIPAIRGHERMRDLPHGELTRSIYRCLVAANGKPVSSKEIVEFIGKRRLELGLPSAYAGRQVKNRLLTLFRKGKLVRHHQQKTTDYGWWSLPNHPSQYIQTLDDDLEHNL